MIGIHRWALRPAAALALLALAAPSARAQGGEQELRELFERVEVQLRRIDDLLNQATRDDVTALDRVSKTDIDKLFRSAKQRGGEVIEDIDRILEIAREMNQGGQSSSSSNSQQPGQPGSSGQGEQGQDGSGSGTRQGQTMLPGESTPSSPGGPTPGQDPGGQEPGGEQGGAQPEGEQPGGQEQGGQPAGNESQGTQPQDGNGQGDPNFENRQGADPSARATAPPPGTVRDADRWGELPMHARRTFRAEGDQDLPAAYRDWIDAYYRRLNRE